MSHAELLQSVDANDSLDFLAQMIRFTRSFYADWQPDVERRLLAEYGLPPGRKVKACRRACGPSWRCCSRWRAGPRC